MTINGLGSSPVDDHRNLTNVSSGQHHTRYSDADAKSAVRTSTGTIDSYGGSQTLVGSSSSDPWQIGFGNGDGILPHDQIQVTVTENDGTSNNRNPVVEEIVVERPDGSETTVWSSAFGYTLSDNETWNLTVNCNGAVGNVIRAKGSMTNDEYSGDWTMDMRPSYII